MTTTFLLPFAMGACEALGDTSLLMPLDMKAIMQKAGLPSKAKAIAFSLPVTDTAGLRLVED